MNFYTKQHKHYCGVDLHSKQTCVCIMDQLGKVIIHKNIKAHPDSFKPVIEPFMDDIAVVAEYMFTWHWLADFCEDLNIAFLLGYALYMRDIHGGNAKNANLHHKHIRDKTKRMFDDKSVRQAIDLDIGLIDHYKKKLESIET